MFIDCFKHFAHAACDGGARSKTNFDREASGSGLNGLTPQRWISMATKKRSRSKGGPVKQSAPAVRRFTIVLSMAVRSVINMTAVVVTSGSVLRFLLTAKRFL